MILVLSSSIALGQQLTVLGDEPFDLSPLTRGETVPLGITTWWFRPLNLTVRLEDMDRETVATVLTEPIDGRRTQNYYDLSLTDLGTVLPQSGYIVAEVQEASTNETLRTTVRQFDNSISSRRVRGLPFEASHPLLMLIVVGVYALFWSLSRWHNIALPTRKLLKAQIEGLRSRLHTEYEFPNLNGNSHLTRIDRQLTNISRSQHLGGLVNFIFWSRGQPIAGWREIHDVERQLVNFYPDAGIAAYLIGAQADLRDVKSTSAILLADRIKDIDFTNTPLVEQKTLLKEALRIIYTYTDTEYARLVTWHNKAAWLMVVALALIFFILSYHAGGAALLLAGAVGGLISRLTRTIRNRRAVPTDYGAYWTSIYLSPVLGALAAWAGVLLLAAFGSLNVLNGPFEQVRWQGISLQDGSFVYADEDTEASETARQGPRTVNFHFSFFGNDTATDTTAAETESETLPDEVALTLGIAVLFGFSERLLSNFTGKLEGAFEKKPAADA